MSGMAASFWWLWQMVLDWMWTLKLWRDFPLKTAFIIQSDAKSMSISHSKARRLNISTWEMAAHGFPILLLLHLILESISACPYGSHSQISVENQVMESVRFLRIMFFSPYFGLYKTSWHFILNIKKHFKKWGRLMSFKRHILYQEISHN